MAERPSPFLPGTKIQYAWDSTSLGWLKTCPRLYQYSMIEGWRARGEGLHLIFGQWYHSALEAYDKYRAEGTSHEDALYLTVEAVLKWTWIEPEQEGQQAAPWDSGDPYKSRETLVRSVIWYLETFGANDAAKTLILANGKPAVELTFKLELDYGPPAEEIYGPGATQPYLLCGHLDRVVTFGNDTFGMDRKTTKSMLTSNYFDQYNPDNQMSLYTVALKVIYQTPIKGIIIDGAQLAVGFTRFGRGFSFRSESQIEEWLAETKAWLRLAESFAIANHWPMNDKSCHQYGGCTFRKVCNKSPDVRQKFLETDFVKKEWNPLVAR